MKSLIVNIKMLWSAEEVAAEIGNRRDDPEWIPHEMKEGGFIVTDAKGNLIAPPKRGE